MAFSVGLSGFFLPGLPHAGDGGSLDLAVVTRLPSNLKNRVEFGLELRGIRTSDATQYAIGVPIHFMFGAGANLELELGITPGYYRIAFSSPYFAGVNAFGSRFSFGLQIPIGPHFLLGLSPATFLVQVSDEIGFLFAYEPRMWLGAALF